MKLPESLIRQIRDNLIDTIFLYDSSVEPEDAAILSEALRANSSVRTIYLSKNHIGDRGCCMLCDALKQNRSVQNLFIDFNNIGDDGARALSDMLRINTALRLIDLNNNEISSEGARLLFEVIKESNYTSYSLTTIALDWNRIGDKGAKLLSKVLREQIHISLQALYLDGNEISSEGATSISEALRINKSVTSISLEWNDISFSIKHAMAENTTRNFTLQSLVSAAATRALQAARLLFNHKKTDPKPSSSSSTTICPECGEQNDDDDDAVDDYTDTDTGTGTGAPLTIFDLPFEVKQHIIEFLIMPRMLSGKQLANILRYASQRETIGQELQVFLRQTACNRYTYPEDTQNWRRKTDPRLGRCYNCYCAGYGSSSSSSSKKPQQQQNKSTTRCAHQCMNEEGEPKEPPQKSIRIR